MTTRLAGPAALLLACSEPAAPVPVASSSAPIAVTIAPSAAPPPSAPFAPEASASAAPSAVVPAGVCEDLVSAKPGVPGAAKKGLRGFDIAKPGPLKALKDAGHAYAFVQAAYGDGRNADFPRLWAGLAACGIPRGAYHFITDEKDGALQARKYLSIVGADRGELPPIVDVEKPVACKDDCCDKPPSFWQVLLDAWLGVVEKETGKKAMIYTVESFWNHCVGGSRKFAPGRALWLAGWPHFDPERKVRFGGWTKWDFFQDQGNVRAGATLVDTDVFAGDAAALADWIRSH